MADRHRPQSTLLAEVAKTRQPGPETVEEAGTEWTAGDDVEALPQPGSAYTAYSRPSNKPEITLHVLLKDGSTRGYAWSNFDSVDTVGVDSPGGGPVLVVRFAGLLPTEVWISGRNLGRLHACIGRQRIVWIREQPSKRGFDAAATDDRTEVITRINFKPWKPDRQAGEMNSDD